MKILALSILVAASAMFASAANAQAPASAPAGNPYPESSNSAQFGPEPGPAYDFWDGTKGVGTPYRMADGVAALDDGDYARAEEILTAFLHGQNSAAVRFYLGVAKMNLGKWDEAKTYLKTAARRLRTFPDPKSRLGVTYAKLGDVEGANAQRAALVEMNEACKGACKNSQYIVDGIQMIDQALARPPAVKPESPETFRSRRR